ncbi:hypothetical protein K151_1833 [Proteus hauseri ZMd44]|nr:hypothetical protein K151_1833 [Proteus hauseri ZMd44]
MMGSESCVFKGGAGGIRLDGLDEHPASRIIQSKKG